MKLLQKVFVPKKSGTGDDTLGRGPDIALTAGVFLLIGLGIDSFTHTRPLFAIVLTVFSLVGSFARMWYVYDDRMGDLQKQRLANATSHQRAEKTAAK